jgi:hypothetical protein
VSRSICTIEGCVAYVKARGLCNAHLCRAVRSGAALPPTKRVATAAERFSERYVLDPETGCWLWTGATTNNGYAMIRAAGRQVYAHRLAYELFVGPIAPGMHLDHVHARGCRHKHCVNPTHLEPVEPAENTRRAAALRTHCPSGHPFDDENTHYTATQPTVRRCKACMREHSARAYAKRRAA